MQGVFDICHREELNISRQAVIKTLLRQGLDRHYLAKSRARKGHSRDSR